MPRAATTFSDASPLTCPDIEPWIFSAYSLDDRVRYEIADSVLGIPRVQYQVLNVGGIDTRRLIVAFVAIW